MSILDFIERRELSDDQVMSFKDFAHKVSKGLDVQSTNFDDQQRIIDLLDLSVTLIEYLLSLPSSLSQFIYLHFFKPLSPES